MKYNKIQIYMAADENEYEKAITWVRDQGYNDSIKEVGYMKTTNWVGKPIDAIIFLFEAPNDTMKELMKYMNIQTKIVPFSM